VAVLASGEEHQHERLNDSTTQALVDVRENDSYLHHHDHHDDHADHDHHDHSHEDHHEHTNHKILHEEISPAQDYVTWMTATGSIIVISLCGVFGIMVVPIMQRVFYQHLIQFLIALAVGTLTGDALLHLLPHAFLAKLNEDSDHGGDHGHGHDHRQHQNAVWLGFTALTSMIGFFVFEKIVNVIGEMREKHNDDRKLRIVREGHVVSDKAVGDAVCKNKYSNYCASELDQLESEGMMVTPSNTATSLVENGLLDNRDTVIISQHEVLHHGHSHAHSHSHSAPHNISSVAWMVIFGDGIHNMADGLAIGAAFADGYMSGFSTSLAVLCHELPHEIGDFAMLLKAGMTIKQAVFYNVLSSVLAFIGMVIGLLLGTIHNFSSWMFTATAGIFLYVALVDMMPELSSGHSHPISSNKQKEAHWLSLVLQVLGMFSGVFIMLAIALYEDELKTVFVVT